MACCCCSRRPSRRTATRQQLRGHLASAANDEALCLEEAHNPAQEAVVAAPGQSEDRGHVPERAEIGPRAQNVRPSQPACNDDLAAADPAEAREHAADLAEADPLVRELSHSGFGEAGNGDEMHVASARSDRRGDLDWKGAGSCEYAKWTLLHAHPAAAIARRHVTFPAYRSACTALACRRPARNR